MSYEDLAEMLQLNEDQTRRAKELDNNRFEHGRLQGELERELNGEYSRAEDQHNETTTNRN